MMFGERTSRTVRVLASAPTLLLLLSAFVIVVPTDVSAIPAPQNAALHVNRRAVVMDAVAVDAHQKVAQSKKEDDDEETYMDSTDFNTPPKSEPAYNNSHAASASKASSPRRHIVQESPKKDDEEEAYMDVATNAPKGDEDVYVQTAPVYDNSAKSARRHVVKQITKDDDEEAYHDSVDMNIIKVDDDEEAYHDSVELVNRPGTANDDDEEVYHDSVQPAAAPVRMAAHRTAKSTYTNVGTACTQAFKNYMLDAASVMSCYNSISNSGGVNVIVSLANEHATRFSNEYKRIMDSPSQRGKSSSCGNVNSLPEFTSLDLLDCYKPSASPKPPRTAKGKVLVVKPPQRKRRPAAAGVTTAKGEPSVVKPASYNVQDIHTAKDIPMTGTNARGARMSKFSGSGDPAKSGPCLKAFENSMLKADIVMDCYNSLVSHGGMDSFIGLARTHSKQFASNYQTIADSVSTTRTLTSCSNVRSMPMFTSLDLLDCYQPTSITTAKGNVLVNFAPNAKTEAVSNAAAPARARHGIAPAAITTPLNNWAAPAAVATPVYKNWAAPAAIATPQNNWVSPAAVATPVHNNWVAPAAVATPYKNWVAPAAVVTPPKNLAAPAAVATPRNEWGSPDRVVDHHNRVAPAAVATPVPTHNAGQNSVDQSAAPVDDKPRRKYRHESTPAIEMGRRVTPQAVKADAGSSPVCTTAFKDSTLTASTVMDCFKSLNAAENGVAPFVDMIKYHASKYNSQYAIPQNGVPNSPTSAILPHSCSNVASKPTFTSLDLLDCYRPASAAHVAASNAGPVLSGILQKPSAAPSVNVERKDMAMDTCNKAFSKTSMVAEDAVNCYMSLNDRKIFVNTVAKYAGFDSIDKVRPYDAACNKLSGSFTAVDLAACYNQLNNGNTATDVPVDVKNVGNQSGLPVQAPPQIGAQIPPQSGLPVPPQIGAQIPPQSGFPVPPQIGITAPPQQAQVPETAECTAVYSKPAMSATDLIGCYNSVGNGTLFLNQLLAHAKTVAPRTPPPADLCSVVTQQFNAADLVSCFEGLKEGRKINPSAYIASLMSGGGGLLGALMKKNEGVRIDAVQNDVCMKVMQTENINAADAIDCLNAPVGKYAAQKAFISKLKSHAVLDRVSAYNACNSLKTTMTFNNLAACYQNMHNGSVNKRGRKAWIPNDAQPYEKNANSVKPSSAWTLIKPESKVAEDNVVENKKHDHNDFKEAKDKKQNDVKTEDEEKGNSKSQDKHKNGEKVEDKKHNDSKKSEDKKTKSFKSDKKHDDSKSAGSG